MPLFRLFRRYLVLSMWIALLGLPVFAQKGLGPMVRVDERVRVDEDVSVPPLLSTSPAQAGSDSYSFKNEGDSALVAWEYRCVTAMNDGRTGWSRRASDSFHVFTWPYLPGRKEVQAETFIQPGELLRVGKGGTFQHDGPLAASSCGLVALVFEDGSIYGSPESLDGIFAQRRALVADMRATLEEVEAALSGKALNRATAEARVGRLGRSPGADLYTAELEEIRRGALTTGRLPREELLELQTRIESNLQEAYGHLRAQDLEEIGVTP